MPINDKCPLVIHGAYSYDIKSAYPTIMGSMNWDFKDIDLDNKKERNIQIGKAQIGNENLSSFLMNSADQLVNFYLNENKIPESDIIVTQRDGFILKSMLNNNDEFIKMEYRGFIDFLILSRCRTMYLSASDNDIDIKGVPHKYNELDKVYNKFLNLNFYNKKVLFNQLNDIKEYVIHCQDKKFFMIPRDKKYAIVTKNLGTLEISSENIFSIEDIDRYKYFMFYFKPFLDSIFLEFY